jgi:plastocyanin
MKRALGLFASPGLDAGDVFSYRFTAPGTYSYFCALHPQMTGTIIVR